MLRCSSFNTSQYDTETMTRLNRRNKSFEFTKTIAIQTLTSRNDMISFTVAKLTLILITNLKLRTILLLIWKHKRFVKHARLINNYEFLLNRVFSLKVEST